MYRIIHQTPKVETVTEYETLEDAQAVFSALELMKGHRYLLIDPEDTILDTMPVIPASVSFTATVRRASNQYAIYISIPAEIRDELMLAPGDVLSVTVKRHRCLAILT